MIGPRIIASEVVRCWSDLSDAWKIAAVEQFDAMGQRTWEWFAGPEARAIIGGIHGGEAVRPTVSAVQGRQRWDGADRCVLYARLMPAGGRR